MATKRATTAAAMPVPTTPAASAPWNTLQDQLRGEVLLPSTPGFDAARALWNAMIDKRPAAIARCTGVADVLAALRFARERDIPLAVRAGGHNVAGTALRDDGLVLDLSRMKGIRVDPAARTVRLQPGILNGDLDHETQAFGLAVTSGIASTTGVSGLTLGGGIGWLMRAFGLTCDNLRTADVVTADGAFITASEEEHPDLFWALRGGGGNFGVVTSFTFDLQPLGPTVLAGAIVFPASAAGEVLRFYRDYIEEAPDALGTIVLLRHAPESPWIPSEHWRKPVVAILACYAGNIAEGTEVLKPLKAFGSPIADIIQPKPYTLHQRMFDASAPPGLRYYWKSHYLSGLSDDAIDTLLARAWRTSSLRSYTVVARMGGAVSRVAESATAFAHRDAQHVLNINGVWTDPAEDAEHIDWTRDMFTVMEPFSTGGVYVNFLGNEGEERVRAAYGTNYDRLVEVKRRYDPDNVFNMNQNIVPG